MEKRTQQDRYWHLSIWIDREQEPAIRDLARREGLTINGLVKHLLARALRDTPPTH